MSILFALLLSIPQPLPRQPITYRQIGPHRTNFATPDDGDRITFFEATILDRDGRYWQGIGMQRDEAEANATRLRHEWRERQPK